jgi:hypothetical protein
LKSLSDIDSTPFKSLPVDNGTVTINKCHWHGIALSTHATPVPIPTRPQTPQLALVVVGRIWLPIRAFNAIPIRGLLKNQTIETIRQMRSSMVAKLEWQPTTAERAFS